MWWWAFCIWRSKSVAEIRALVADCEKRAAGAEATPQRIDYYCWDTLHARVAVVLRAERTRRTTQRKKLRYDTLHQIEHGGNETAEVAELISTAVLRRHLETMLRLDIEYDFLPRESEILHLKFWEKRVRTAQADAACCTSKPRARTRAAG